MWLVERWGQRLPLTRSREPCTCRTIQGEVGAGLDPAFIRAVIDLWSIGKHSVNRDLAMLTQSALAVAARSRIERIDCLMVVVCDLM